VTLDKLQQVSVVYNKDRAHGTPTNSPTLCRDCRQMTVHTAVQRYVAQLAVTRLVCRPDDHTPAKVPMDHTGMQLDVWKYERTM